MEVAGTELDRIEALLVVVPVFLSSFGLIQKYLYSTVS
jgi:hypothetical protein